MTGSLSLERKTETLASLAEATARLGCRVADGPRPTILNDGGGVDAALRIVGGRETFEAALHRSGAILLRGFDLGSLAAFERFAGQVLDEIFTENGEHQALAGSAKVQTPVAFAADQRLFWHNENTFNRDWPTKILFGAAQPAAVGGETPIVDGRLLYQHLNALSRQRFQDLGVMYVRNFSDGLGLSWQTVFRVTTREQLAARCREQGIDFEWLPDGRLRTRAVRPAVGPHPVTGEMCWFAQPQHFHPACLDPETRESFALLFAEEDYPRHCYYGDGSMIEDDVMSEILDLYDELETAFLWQEGDVMVVDNVAAAHGRNPYRGERKLLVAMGDLIRYEIDGSYRYATASSNATRTATA